MFPVFKLEWVKKFTVKGKLKYNTVEITPEISSCLQTQRNQISQSLKSTRAITEQLVEILGVN